MNRHRFWIVAVAFAVVAAGLVSAHATSRMMARPTAVAVADLQRVFENLNEKVQLEADIQSQAEQIKQEQDKRQRELQLLKGDLDLLAPDTPAYQQKQSQLEQEAIQLQAWMAFQQKKLQRERVAQIENLYQKVLDTLSAISKQNGYDVVLFKEQDVDFKNAKPEQLSGAIQVRKVLYAADDLDITDQVITRMNNDFKNSAN